MKNTKLSDSENNKAVLFLLNHIRLTAEILGVEAQGLLRTGKEIREKLNELRDELDEAPAARLSLLGNGGRYTAMAQEVLYTRGELLKGGKDLIDSLDDESKRAFERTLIDLTEKPIN